MADTTALKNRIRAAIKANDNQEITGPVLQQALLDVVDELNGATETEASARQNGDSTLQQGINTERQQRQEADTTLGQRITGETQRAQEAEQVIDGKASKALKEIASLEIEDVTGSVAQATEMSIALQTNEGSAEDPDILTLDTLIIPQASEQKAGLLPAKNQWDNRPTRVSEKLVKSGGVFQDLLLLSGISDLIYSKKGKALNKNTGETFDTEGYNTSDFIPVNGITELTVSGYVGSSVTILCFYNKNKAFISSGNFPHGGGTFVINSNEFPENTFYVRVSDGGSGNAYTLGLFNLFTLYNSALSSFDIAKQIAGNMEDLYYINTVIHSNGAEDIVEGYYATDYLPLKGIDRFWWKGSNGVSAIGLAFYGENKNFLGYYGNLSNTYEKEITKDEFPTGAAYVRATNTGTSLSNKYIYGVPLITNLYNMILKVASELGIEKTRAEAAEQTLQHNLLTLWQHVSEQVESKTYSGVRYQTYTPKDVLLKKGYKVTLSVTANTTPGLFLRGYIGGVQDGLITFASGETGTKSITLTKDYDSVDFYASSGTWDGSFEINSYDISIDKQLLDLQNKSNTLDSNIKSLEEVTVGRTEEKTYSEIRYAEYTPKEVLLKKGYIITVEVTANNVPSLDVRFYRDGSTRDNLIHFASGETGIKSTKIYYDYTKLDFYASSGTWSGSLKIDSYDISIKGASNKNRDILDDITGNSSAKILYINKNKALKNDGSTYDAEGYNTSDFIPVVGITKLEIVGYIGTYPTILCYYDDKKGFLGNINNIASVDGKRTVTPSDFPEGTTYIRVSDGGSGNAYAIGLFNLPTLYRSLIKPFDIAKQVAGNTNKLYWKNENIHYNGSVSVYSGYYATDYLSLEGVDRFWWKGSNGSSAIGLAFYNSEKQFLGYYGELNKAYEVEILRSEFPEGAAYVRATNTGYPLNTRYIYGVPMISETYEYAKKAYDSLVNISDVTVTNVVKLFNVAPATAYGRNYAIKLYLEGLLRDNVGVTFDGGSKERIIQSLINLPETGGTLTTSHSVKVVNNNVVLATKNFSLVSSSITRGKNRLFNVLMIGDSTLDMDLANASGVKQGGWNYCSCVKEFIEKDNIDVGNIKATMIGIRNNQSGRTVNYNNHTVNLRAFSEGRAGWTCYGYLNFPCPVKMGVAYESNPRLNSPAAWYALGLATKTPFDSSVAGQEWQSFEDTLENRLLIATTPFGRYKSDYGSTSEQYEELSDLWTRVNYMSGIWTVGSYTGTAEQKQFLDNFFSNKMQNPDNPFYSQSKARVYTGNYVWINDNAFSLDAYLSRYRTLDDLGERLSGSAGETVIGSDGETYTIGSKVTDVNNYDVCTPNYVFVGTGINDVDGGFDVAKETIINLINCICDEDNNIKVAWGILRSPFVFNNCYHNINGRATSSGGGRFDINEEILSQLTDSTQNSRKMFLPIYNTMSVIGGNNCRASLSLDDDSIIISHGNDNVHPSIYQSRTMAYQIYSWLYYIN